MTNPQVPDPYQPDPFQPQSFSAPPYAPAPYSPAPYAPVPMSPGAQPYLMATPAPYGVDPISGYPLSDKSKVVAGLLQLVPGFVLGLGGIGRLYAGHTALGIVQLAATAFGWVSFWCGFLLLFPFFLYAGVWFWFVIDGIVLMVGRPVDGHGRMLRT